MTHPERVGDYLEHMAEAVERAIKYAGRVGSLDALEHDEFAQDAIVRTIAVVGEAANRNQRMAPEFQGAHPELPWNQMRGIRNKVIHDYFDVAWDVVWDTIRTDFPPLLLQIRSLLESLKRTLVPRLFEIDSAVHCIPMMASRASRDRAALGFAAR